MLDDTRARRRRDEPMSNPASSADPPPAPRPHLDGMHSPNNGVPAGEIYSFTVEQLMAQAQDTLRKSRAASLRATQVMMDSYAAMVSGVLIGMSEGLSAAAAPPAAGKSTSKP